MKLTWNEMDSWPDRMENRYGRVESRMADLETSILSAGLSSLLFVRVGPLGAQCTASCGALQSHTNKRPLKQNLPGGVGVVRGCSGCDCSGVTRGGPPRVTPSRGG